MQITQANYPIVKAALETIGFGNLPAASTIAFEQPLPFNLEASIAYKTASVQTVSQALQPAA